MKNTIVLLLFSAFLFSCSEDNQECACYDHVLKHGEITEACKPFVEGLSQDELKEKSNECFTGTIQDLTGM